MTIQSMRTLKFTLPAVLALQLFGLTGWGSSLPVPSPHHLVACAPGYPGTTQQAQPTMDAFAAMVSAVAGWPQDRLTAEYQQTESGGVERLAEPASTLGLVPLPFFLKHEEQLGFDPIAQVVQRNGSTSEIWSLAAPAGRVSAAGDLEGWELAGIPAYAPAFVRGPVLGAWGRLPDSTRITFSRRVLAALRRASAGEAIAVLLDSSQAAALASLPSAERLEVVATSPPLPAALLVTVGGRVSSDDAARLLDGVLRVHTVDRFAEVLDTLRLVGFEELDSEALQYARDAYRAAAR